jgi:hypothetical protein
LGITRFSANAAAPAHAGRGGNVHPRLAAKVRPLRRHRDHSRSAGPARPSRPEDHMARAVGVGRADVVHGVPSCDGRPRHAVPSHPDSPLHVGHAGPAPPLPDIEAVMPRCPIRGIACLRACSCRSWPNITMRSLSESYAATIASRCTRTVPAGVS